jgi:hypothetical protein
MKAILLQFYFRRQVSMDSLKKAGLCYVTTILFVDYADLPLLYS